MEPSVSMHNRSKAMKYTAKREKSRVRTNELVSSIVVREKGRLGGWMDGSDRGREGRKWPIT
jgi:hypothetical protein